MYSLISFATQWGSKYGGINSFNTDFLNAFGVAYSRRVQVVCIVMSATDEEMAEAWKCKVKLVPLPYKAASNELGAEEATIAINSLEKNGITFKEENTIWLGHDRITGAAAITAAKSTGSRSAIIHHMSYNHYEAFAENSQSAYEKVQVQRALLRQADVVLAVGPLLRDAASDRLDTGKSVHMLIPGLAEIKVRQAPKFFTAFMSGRLSHDSARIKQGHLSIAAFAQAHNEARNNSMPEALCNEPKLVLRGVDFESERKAAPESNVETELRKFAEEYAKCVINLHALPFTQDRETLYEDLSAASVALMPSWHEGFGLVAWEAIAAGVPLIISKKSGVYQLLKEEHPAGPGCVYPIDVRGSVEEPFFHQNDVCDVVEALKDIAKNPSDARRKAGALRNMLGVYSWTSCVGQATKAFDWPLHQGSIHKAVPPCIPLTPELDSHEKAYSPSVTPLHIPSKQWKLGIGLTDSMLLRAEEEVVCFDPARQPEVDLLNAWLDTPEWAQAIRLIAAPGGAGKTRLALELCRQRLSVGWVAGFLDTTLDIPSIWQTLKNCHKSLLIVIDYAETRQTALLALIRAMLKAPNDHSVRLLLLARAGGEWWDNLPSKDSVCENLLSSYATSLFNLPALHSDMQGRKHAYQRALQSFAEALNVTAPDISPDLSFDYFERPLYVQMAALLALHGERPITAEGLTRALLHHERRYWRGLFNTFGWAEPESLAQQLLALATLAGGFATPKEAGSYWSAAGLSVLSGSDFNTLFSTLAPLYPGKQGLQAFRPDILGEALVAQTLLQPECGNLLNAVLARTASQTIRRHALTVLARLSGSRIELYETLITVLTSHYADCCQDLVAVAVETPSDLPILAEVAYLRLAPAARSQVTGMLTSVVARESVQLAGLSCVMAEFMAEKARQKLEKKPNHLAFLAEYSSALGNYSLSLSIAGRNESALAHSLRALKLFEQLFTSDKKKYEAGYAKSLSNHASDLSDAGKNEEALEYAQQALAIRQRLAQKNPDRYEPDLATSFNNYAAHLSNAGKNEEALEYAQQALTIYQRLAQKNPDRYEPDLASSLNNYATHLSDAGKNEEALEYAQQSLTIRQHLAQKNPDRYEPDLASSLNNYATHLSDAGKNAEALEYAQQSLTIRQRLAQKNPDRYDPDLAMSLNNYAADLGNAGKSEEGLVCVQQALAINQRLAQKNPDRYDPDLATSLNNYTAHLGDAGKSEEAIVYAQQALAINQRLAQKNPDRYDPDLAMSLNRYATHLSDAGKDEEALLYVRQALAIRQRLAEKSLKRFADDLYCTVCYESFLSWLSNYPGKIIELTQLLLSVPSHRRLLLELYAAFVYGCWSEDQESRSEAFAKVISNWSNLTTVAKKEAESYWLCTVAWCDRFFPDMIESLDWQSVWGDYVLQRKGHVPAWLNNVSRRLNFSWPKVMSQ
ncbi:tetratricopeptide repeat protein [Geobacter sp. SVR]|uniref:tetratricopeptide repeat protein n=1 Tax=Geobacter sp. SVR TaxID=2495594 RepID=UPI00143EF988|nr:tetratricopeptide repeat protein [Geobacter sp. SVR]BCS55434.1 hypothetical protein GSVR_37420 [Geobacter sp. SVR]GCF83436.1 hypothetical protein GSbR_00360 [Geobacter sp. SVR]